MVYIRRINEGEYGDIPVPTGYLAPNNSIPHIPNDFFDKKKTIGTIISKRIEDNKYLMLIKFDGGVEEISFKIDKYMNHKVGDEIEIKMKNNESQESMMDDVYFVSDALIMAFDDGNIPIDEVELMKGYGPEESVIRAKREPNQRHPNIESVAFCMGYTMNNMNRGLIEVDNSMNLSLFYNSMKLTPIAIERIMARFYRRIVRFGWCKVGDKNKKHLGALTILNIRIEKLKPKEKK